MRVLWLSPWLRSIARTHSENLQALGAEVMLVTSDLHPESDDARPYETVLLGRPIPTSDWWPVLTAYRRAERFKPDVVVTEFIRDPRWRIFTRLAPRIRMLHDDVPHDATHVAPWWNRLFFESWDEKADATIVFSENVAESLRRHHPGTRSRLFVAPLISDLPAELVPPFVPGAQRRNIVLVGRQRPYKNHRVVFEAWDAHIRGKHWPGDELMLFGNGDVDCPLPDHARWVRRGFQYKGIVAELAAARASLVHCRNASQSGVQVLSLQLGVPTLVSTAGGLPEYQPEGLGPIGIDDVDGLTRTMDLLADPAEVEVQGKRALEHFRSHLEPPVAAQRLLEIFDEVRHTA
jgi:glycosyltransferase involved in cell wall biosynthesis